MNVPTASRPLCKQNSRVLTRISNSSPLWSHRSLEQQKSALCTVGVVSCLCSGKDLFRGGDCKSACAILAGGELGSDMLTFEVEDVSERTCSSGSKGFSSSKVFIVRRSPSMKCFAVTHRQAMRDKRVETEKDLQDTVSWIVYLRTAQ